MDNEKIRLIRRISGILAAIQQDIHSINEDEDSPENQQQSPRQIDIQSTVRLVPPIENYYASEERDRPSKNKRDSIRLVLEGGTLIAAVLAAIFTYRTLKEFQKQTPKIAESADAAKSASVTAKEALESGQRAFVFNYMDQGRDGDFWRVTIKWQNSGDTPTRNMIMHITDGGLRLETLPKNFNFPDIWQPGEQHAPTHIGIPPKGLGQGIETRIPVSSVTSAKKFPIYHYIWGWARYYDVFPGTKQHVTIFCDEFTASQFGAGSMNINAPESQAGNACAAHNCADEECDKQ